MHAGRCEETQGCTRCYHDYHKSLKSIFGLIGTNLSLMLGSSPVREYMHYPSASPTPSLSAGLPTPKTQEMLRIMVLQHAVRYHKARDWIRQQDQSQLTYQSLPYHCKLLESRCEQYQKARERGCASLALITVALASSIHIDALTTSSHTHKCGYSHPSTKCPAYGQQCYTFSSSNHFTALCKQRRWWQTGKQTPCWGDYTPQKSKSKHHGCHSSHSPHRHHCQCPSHSTSHSPSYSHSHNPAHSASPQWSNWHHCHATPHWYSQDSIKVIPTDSIITSTQPEGLLYTESVSDGQVAFYTRLQLPTHDATLERLRIIMFIVPNLAATSGVDSVAVSTPLPKVVWGRLLKLPWTPL